MVEHITVHLTNRCNLKCTYCHVAADCGRGEGSRVDQRWIERMLLPSVESVSIAGGEPILVKDRLYHFLNEIPESVKSIAVTTNGILLQESDFIKMKKKGIRLQFSVDGMAEGHEKNRGGYTFQKTMSSIKRALEHKIRVDILTIVSKKNIGEMIPYIRMIDTLGVDNLTLLHFTPKGRGAFQPEQEISQGEWMQFCYGELSKLRDISVRVWVQPRFLTRKQAEKISRVREVQICNMHRWEYAYIDSVRGDVYPCGLAFQTDLKIGNLEDASLDMLVQKALEDVRVPEECGECKNHLLCKGGAKCYAWLAYGDMNQRDPYCSGRDILPICPFPAVQAIGRKMKTKRPTIV